MFGADGWVVHSQTNPFGFTGVIGYPLAFWMPDAGGWLAQHYWEHYQFTQDKRFLKERAYPLMKELAAFWIDELQVDGRFYERVGGLLDDGSDNPPRGWDNPYQAGRVTRSGSVILFSDDKGHRERFELRPGATPRRRRVRRRVSACIPRWSR